jgi:hypothetical protein
LQDLQLFLTRTRKEVSPTLLIPARYPREFNKALRLSHGGGHAIPESGMFFLFR